MAAPFSLIGDLNVVTLLYFLAFVATVVMATYVALTNKFNGIARIFVALSVAFAFIHLGEAFLSWTTVAADARAFYAFKAVGFIFWWPIGLLLFLTLSGRRPSRGYTVFLGLCFAYSAVLVVATLLGICRQGDDLAKIGWTWIDTPYWHPLAVPYLAMMPACLVLDMVQMFIIRRQAARAGNAKTVRQMNLIAATGVFAFVVGTFFNIVAPLIGLAAPSIGHLFLGLWIYVLGYAIVRYRLFVPTLEYAGRQIFHLAGEMIVLTDNDYNITDSNDSFVRRFGMDAMNCRLSDLLLEGAGPVGELDPSVRDRILQLLTGDAAPVYVKINGSPLVDRNDRIGYVFVLADISGLKEENVVLETRVRDRTLELEKQKTEAERRLKVTEIYTRRSIVECISSGDDPTRFKPVSRALAVLFADIRDFTTISEDLSPLETVELLNQYFDAMNSVILGNDGEIDKLIGDCIMALYRSPDDAVASAIMMRKTLQSFNDGRRLPMRVNNGIGINFGDVISGNIGSSDKMDYTVIGDTVNVSSRLEALTKYYRLPILVSGETVQRLEGKYCMRFIDTVLVKGRRMPIDLHEVFDFEPDEIKLIKTGRAELYRELYERYRLGDFRSALAGYLDLRADLGPHKYLPGACKDPVVDLYADRCRVLLERREAGVLEAWNGVYEFAEK
jgi:class 3 adenylate cyclase